MITKYGEIPLMSLKLADVAADPQFDMLSLTIDNSGNPDPVLRELSAMAEANHAILTGETTSKQPVITFVATLDIDKKAFHAYVYAELEEVESVILDCQMTSSEQLWLSWGCFPDTVGRTGSIFNEGLHCMALSAEYNIEV